MSFKLSDLREGQHLNSKQWDELYEEIRGSYRMHAHPNVEAGVTNITIWPVIISPVGIKDGELEYVEKVYDEQIRFTVPLS